MKNLLALPVALALISCGGDGAGEVAAPVAEAPACDLSLDSLPDHTFVWQKEQDAAGKWTENPLGRVRFEKEGEALKAKYTVASLASVYGYTCKAKDEDDLVCKQDNPDLLEFCRALWANVGDCTADQMAAVVGTDVTPEITKAVEKVTGEIKKMKPDEQEKMKRAYNSPNVQLRGLLEVHVVKKSAEECRLTVSDLYETFTQGSSRKMENLVGLGARFVPTEKEYLFEDCRDLATNLIAVPEADPWGKPGQTQVEGWAAGDTAHVRYVGEAHAKKPDASCTYTMDTYYAGAPLGKQVPVTETDSHGLKWSFDAPVRDMGTRAIAMVRWKACSGGQPEKIDVTCTPVKAQ